MRVENNSAKVGLTAREAPQSEPLVLTDLNTEIKGKEDFRPQDTKIKGIGPQELREALDTINKTVRIFNRSIHFSKHEESGRMWIQIIDTETKKVVREIPPKEILDIVARLEEMVGLLIDERR